ncbi:ArnT family glycosyltransferase [Marinagarivorans algicola]|uniref:ArnT family glycosyltransferase n=1 Tax=Marinagarivorans algicola TaxID=1513270 RepID=UPI0006B93560|nr:hypothetical protein [Marinagarivorans algicola]
MLNNKLKALNIHNRRHLYYLIAVIALVAIFFHYYKVDTLPRGYYLDETSFGLNSATLVKDGTDEYGTPWPLYFKAYGEYKNPIFIYATAGFFKIFGISELSLRLTNVTFYVLAYLIFIALLFKVFRSKPYLIIWGTIAFGLLPSFFAVSRVSFGVNTQLPWVVAIILFAYIALSTASKATRLKASLVLAALIGTSVYTYTTARLLSFLIFLTFAFCLIDFGQLKRKRGMFVSHENLKILLLMVLIIIITLIPYIIFAIDVPGGLTGRFKGISYVDDPIPLTEKVGLFVFNYSNYWWSNYLISDADHNLRHSIGYGGAFYLSVILLSVICLVVWVKNRVILNNRFVKFIFISWLLSPIAAATINDMNVLRTFTTGIYWVIGSCFGLQYLYGILVVRAQKPIVYFLFGFLILESCIYLLSYFVMFPERSIAGSESYDVKATYESALSQEPKRIWFLAIPYASYTNIKFRMHTVGEFEEHPVKIVYRSSDIKVMRGDCVIYQIRNEAEIKTNLPIRYQERNAFELNFAQKVGGAWPRDHYTRLRCY